MKKLLFSVVLITTASCMGGKGTYPGPQQIPTTAEIYEKKFGNMTSMTNVEYEEREKAPAGDVPIEIKVYFNLKDKLNGVQEKIEGHFNDSLKPDGEESMNIAQAKSKNDKLEKDLGLMQKQLSDITKNARLAASSMIDLRNEQEFLSNWWKYQRDLKQAIENRAKEIRKNKKKK